MTFGGRLNRLHHQIGTQAGLAGRLPVKVRIPHGAMPGSYDVQILKRRQANNQPAGTRRVLSAIIAAHYARARLPTLWNARTSRIFAKAVPRDHVFRGDYE